MSDSNPLDSSKLTAPRGHENKGIVCLYEFLGSALLIITINWSATFGTLQPFAIGIILFCNIMVFG